MKKETFDETYFERGVKTGVSGYTRYHWRPEYVMELANELKQMAIRNSTFLDYGCAKGYLVKALRLLDCDAYGFDISEYAIKNADKSIKKYVSTKIQHPEYDVVIAKDVLEHVPHEHIDDVLKELRSLTVCRCVVIVPLGDNGLFRIREYELDKTHVIKEDEEWWINKFKKAGFRMNAFHYSHPGVKNHWLKVHPHGNAMFVLEP
jgi:hypothetical protein